jgi:hypothetical protein
MSTMRSRCDLDDLEVSASARDAALRVVERLTREKQSVARDWATAVKLAKANGASLRDIAAIADASPQSIANVCNR